jgi:hypothetical protein
MLDQRQDVLGSRLHVLFPFVTALVYLLSPTAVSAQSHSAPPIPPTSPQSSNEQAQTLALIGHNALHLGRISEAQTDCDAALKLDPANSVAKDCLNWAAGMLIDQDLNNAEAKLLTGDKTGAIGLASKWIEGRGSDNQHARAKAIIKNATGHSLIDLMNVFLPPWLREVLITIVILAGVQLILLAARVLWREWKRGEWYGNLTNTTKWSMLPLKEYPATSGEQTGLATDAVLDALARIGHELQQPVWKPHLLLLRPTPPANYEPAIITEFLSNALDCIVIAPAADDLYLEWKLHDIRLDDAVQNLQLKASSGIDIGSVARFVASVAQWFNAGAPIISGIGRTVADKTVSLHLAAHGGRIQAAAVTASTEAAPGIDAMELSAERVAFKFLFRMRYPDMTNDQIDGFAALRQGAAQLRNTPKPFPEWVRMQYLVLHL